MTGSYPFASCGENVPNACLFNGRTVASGDGVTAYLSSFVPYGQGCTQETRTCSNGKLAGSYNFASCNIGTPASCQFNGQTIAHGQTVTAYLHAIAPVGSSCASESRSCVNGMLSGSFAHASCQALVAPGAPTGAQAKPTGSGQVTVTWQPPVDVGSGITGYTVSAHPGAQTCTPSPATATACTFNGLVDGQTYTFTVEASNDAGSAATPAPSNPATPLSNPKAFSAPAPTGTGPLAVAVAGGGATCAFESVQLVPTASAAAAPPAGLQFPHGLLDFVLAGCDASNVTLTITYPSALPRGVQYWKLRGNTWAPYANATAAMGSTTATLTLRDGGPGDDDGDGANGRIVDPSQVAVMALASGGAVGIPTLSQWALALLVILLGLVGFRRHQQA